MIRELFTPLPCPADPQTTLGLEGCAEKAILRTDRAIDSQVKVVFGLLGSEAARRSFVNGERSWLAYRGASCTAQVSNSAGGSIEPVVYGDCIAARNETHLTDLTGMRKALGRH